MISLDQLTSFRNPGMNFELCANSNSLAGMLEEAHYYIESHHAPCAVRIYREGELIFERVKERDTGAERFPTCSQLWNYRPCGGELQNV